mmetsp:Transcript_51435/g.159526  ORF Transcript_51435/g.159526 Transcript_51435/m.159526 type:complete len:319 (-) Transcript_51435:50-1006(-)
MIIRPRYIVDTAGRPTRIRARPSVWQPPSVSTNNTSGGHAEKVTRRSRGGSSTTTGLSSSLLQQLLSLHSSTDIVSAVWQDSAYDAISSANSFSRALQSRSFLDKAAISTCSDWTRSINRAICSSSSANSSNAAGPKFGLPPGSASWRCASMRWAPGPLVLGAGSPPCPARSAETSACSAGQRRGALRSFQRPRPTGGHAATACWSWTAAGAGPAGRSCPLQGFQCPRPARRATTAARSSAAAATAAAERWGGTAATVECGFKVGGMAAAPLMGGGHTHQCDANTGTQDVAMGAGLIPSQKAGLAVHPSARSTAAVHP